jgi:hypothetical protein
MGVEDDMIGPAFTVVVATLSMALLFTSSSASGDTTAEMLSACKRMAEAEVQGDMVAIPQDFRSGVCWGAFITLQDLIVKAHPGGQPIFRVCAPPASTRTQLIAVFVDYAKRNPRRLHEDFFEVSLDSLRAVFPCQSR